MNDLSVGIIIGITLSYFLLNLTNKPFKSYIEDNRILKLRNKKLQEDLEYYIILNIEKDIEIKKSLKK